MYEYTEIKSCRVCQSSNLISAVNLGTMSLTGIFPERNERKPPSGPLELLRCEDCGMVQLRHSYPPSDLYGEKYGYRSGLNIAMVRHLEGVVGEIEDRIELRHSDLVVDIGSNDGTLLNSYSNRDLRFLGVDPSATKFARFYKNDISRVPEFFNRKTLESVAGNSRAKVITSISMFYDLEDPIAFVNDIRESLDDNGIWVSEQSYLPLMLERNSYDTICHEHIEYYSMAQILKIASMCGLKVVDVQTNEVNGGSFRFICAKIDSKHSVNTKAIEALLEFEQRNGVTDGSAFDGFKKRIDRSRTDLKLRLEEAKKRGQRVFGYGASTKGNVLLQYCQIGPDDLEAIAEVNEDKFGCFTPGTDIPIISESEARSRNPDVFLVLPWHFRNMIVEKETEFLNIGNKLLFPLPDVELVR